MMAESVAHDFVANFINEAVSPYFVVQEGMKRLVAAGFEKQSEREEWVLEYGKSYFFTRNGSALVAFSVGGKFKPGHGFTIVGTHTDSPHLRVKPRSAISKGGFLQVGVETYGGGLWHTWFDRYAVHVDVWVWCLKKNDHRDLTVAGRVVLRRDEDQLETALVHIKRPILRIPTIAPHLHREVREAFKFNDETHLLPVLATAIKGELEGCTGGAHHPVLIDLLSHELNVDPSAIVTFDLAVVDTQPAVIGGAREEFIFSGRQDNLISSFCALRALIDSQKSLAEDPCVRVLVMFDHEECGSQSTHGAGSTLLQEVIKRVTEAFMDNSMTKREDLFARAFRSSFLISADLSHALHPNYTEKHEARHQPEMHRGPVIKYNANQRYATTDMTSTIVKELARRRDIPIQEFVVRNDSPCGSTIGPILSKGTGIRTVDIGNAQLSMHSIREMTGTCDVDYACGLYTAFFEEFPSVDALLRVD